MNYSSSQEQALCFGNNNQQEYVAQDGIDSFRYEMNKGCSGEIFNYPLLSIAPPYRFFRGYELLGETKIEEQPPKKLKTVHLILLLLLSLMKKMVIHGTMRRTKFYHNSMN